MEKVTVQKLNTFFAKFKPIHYRKGEMIIRADDIPQGVFYISSGYVRLYSVFADGNEITFNIFKPGSYFPMLWAIGDLHNNYYFQAMTPTDIYRAPRALLVQFIKQNSEILFELTNRILIGLDGLLTNVEYMLTGSAYHRIVSTLLISARRFGQNTTDSIIVISLPLTHQDIAHLSGLTRETTSIEMKKLERKGLISYKKRQIIIKNMKFLERESLLTKDESALAHTI